MFLGILFQEQLKIVKKNFISPSLKLINKKSNFIKSLFYVKIIHLHKTKTYVAHFRMRREKDGRSLNVASI